jgi:hypothetical protein
MVLLLKRDWLQEVFQIEHIAHLSMVKPKLEMIAFRLEASGVTSSTHLLSHLVTKSGRSQNAQDSSESSIIRKFTLIPTSVNITFNNTFTSLKNWRNLSTHSKD